MASNVERERQGDEVHVDAERYERSVCFVDKLVAVQCKSATACWECASAVIKCQCGYQNNIDTCLHWDKGFMFSSTALRSTTALAIIKHDFNMQA